jgi:adenylyltransferase/sulfurtransferase
MPNTINIPTPLRPSRTRKSPLKSAAPRRRTARRSDDAYEGLRKHLYADNGKLRNFVNVYLNDEDIRYLQREQNAGEIGRHAQHRAFRCRWCPHLR